jgi:hypothetical protein
MRVNVWRVLLSISLAAAVGACGSNKMPAAPTGEDARVTSLRPAQILQSDVPQTVTVEGINFVSGITATLTDPSGGARTFSGGDILAFQANSFQIIGTFSLAGSYSLQVRNTSGVPSTPFSFLVQSQVSGTTPQISSVSPGSTLHSNNAQFLTINGSQFAPSLTVTLIDPTGQPQQLIGAIVGVVTPTQFQVLITLSRVGTYTIFVTNPTGEISNSISIPVQ